VNHTSAHFALVTRGRATAGETLLVHGAAGGVGSAALELGRASGMRTIAVVSTDAKAEFAQAVGAHDVVRVEDWKSQVEALVGTRGVDVVLDPVGGDRFVDSLRVLADLGRLLVVGFVGGAIPEVKVNRLLLNNLSVVGVATGPFMERHPGELARQWSAVQDLLLRVESPSPEATTFDVADVDVAIAHLAQRDAVGKVALSFEA
jgi:NADPH:quinone reductase